MNAKNKNTDNIGNQKKKINADDNSDLDSGTEAEEDSNYVENESDEVDEKGDEITEKLTKPKKKLKKPKGGKKEAQQNDIKKNKVTKTPKKINNKKETEKANIENAKGKLQKSSKKKKKRSKKKEILLNGVNGVVKNDEKIIQVPKIRKSLNGEATPVEKKQFNGGFEEETIAEKESLNSSSKKKNGVKRKILSDWVVQDIEETSPEYNRIKPQKVIKLEVKFDRSSDSEENQEPDKLKNSLENIESDNEIKKTGKVFTPVFWEKAKAKVLKKKKSSNVFMVRKF